MSTVVVPIIEQKMEHTPAIISKCCILQMSVLSKEEERMRFLCPGCGGSSKPMAARDYRKDVRRKIELLCDEGSWQNLSKDTRYILWLINRWHEWLDPEMNNLKSHMREIRASEDILNQLNREASQKRFSDKETSQWRKTLRNHIRSLCQ